MGRYRKFVTALIIGLGLVLLAGDLAEARRLGSFGSRGARTFQAPSPTRTAPKTAPIERSMTPQNPSAAPVATGRQPATASARSGMFGSGFGGSVMRGLLIGGLIGMLLGYGFGGMAGVLGLLVQLAIAMLVATLVVRWFANRRQVASRGTVRREMAMAGAGEMAAAGFGGGSASGPAAYAPVDTPTMFPDARVEQSDLDDFERLLSEVQEAFAREDYAALRAITTPEVMSYLSEELGQNATAGVRNDVSATKLLQGDVSETWNEDETQYATVAMRYESLDVMRERASGRIVSGDAGAATEATELWTFVRPRGGSWKLSAIQQG
jgi:predicted lipid-binding transport protein (Tim44 family)